MGRDEKPRDRAVAGGSGTIGDALKKLRRPRPPSKRQAERLLSGEAWDDLCHELEAAGKKILTFNPGASGLERAAGFRYLAGLVNAALRFSIDFADPSVPRFFRSPDSRTQWGGENADNQYLIAAIASDRAYRLSGSRGSAFDFLIEVKEGFMQLGDDRVFETVAASDLELALDASFEIVLSAERPAGHTGPWIPIHPEAKLIVIRQYFWDWEHEEPARFRIECIGNEGRAPAPMTAERVGEVVTDAADWIEASVRVWNQWVERIRADHRPGQVVAAIKLVGGADTIRYGNDYYHLEPGEALIVESEIPDARYWEFQLCGLWFEGRDYTNRETSINGHQAHIDPDLRFRCVIAHEDPGVANWLDAAGHVEGLLQYRWVWTKNCPQPTCRTVELADVRSHLPADTPTVTPQQRRRRVVVRQRHMTRREPWC